MNLPDKEYKYIPQPSLVEETDLTPYEYDKNYFNILYCGNLGTIQLIDLIPETMNLLKDKKIRFHIIGMGPMTDNLLEDIKKYGLEESIIYHGPMNAKKASVYFKSCDALYVSLKDDGVIGKTIPNKLVMSLAFAKPIVAVLSGDGKDILLNTKGALLAEEDPNSLASAIEKASRLSKEERETMGNNNLTYFNKNFKTEKITKDIETELINKLR